MQEKSLRTLQGIHWHLPGGVVSQCYWYNSIFSQCDMICWFCSDLGRQALAYHSLQCGVSTPHKSVQKEGRLQKNCEINCYNKRRSPRCLKCWAGPAATCVMSILGGEEDFQPSRSVIFMPTNHKYWHHWLNSKSLIIWGKNYARAEW